MGIGSLYYEHYAENCAGRYWEERESLPYQLLIPDRKQKEMLVNDLKENGFKCVSALSPIPQSLYVNFTLKRYGGAQKACGSSSINGGMMGYDEFMENIYLPYKQHPEVREVLENNWDLSAAILIERAYHSLLKRTKEYPDNIGTWDKDDMEKAVNQIRNGENKRKKD